MNSIYKIVFNKATQTFTAVSELAKGATKTQGQSAKQAGTFLPKFAKITLAISMVLGLSTSAIAVTDTDFNALKARLDKLEGNNNTVIVDSIALGGWRNDALGQASVILGGNKNKSTGAFSIVGNGAFNKVIDASYSTIVNGYDNKIVALGSKQSGILAGEGNLIKSDNGLTNYQMWERDENGLLLYNADGSKKLKLDSVLGSRIGHSAIGSGIKNTIRSGASFIGSGVNNRIAGKFGTTKNQSSTIVSGEHNTIIGGGSGILAGSGNEVKNNFASVISGVDNKVDGRSSSILTGEFNQVIGKSSTIMGGQNNIVEADFATVLSGKGNKSLGKGSLTAGGYGDIVGGSAYTDGSMALGTGTVAGIENSTEEAVAMGYRAKAVADKTLALGFDAKAEHKNSVALGSKAETRDFTQVDGTEAINGLKYKEFSGIADGVVSVGKTANEKQIINVAPGEISQTSTDAINGSQLYATTIVLGNVATSVKDNLGGNAAIDENGNITFTDIGGTGKDTVQEAIAFNKGNIETNTANINGNRTAIAT
ncbi:ESPR-type extended signal peptide-containing protein, partial [Phocoenobacter skyensis]